MTKIKPQSEFPLMDLYQEYFKDITDKTVFAYNNTIYSNYPMSDDFIKHEETHLKQQDKIGLSNWVNQYLENKQFRLEQEIEAFKVQLNSIKDRNHKKEVLFESAKNLSGKLYGNLLTLNEAINILLKK
jgi:hypothetical protein